MNQESLLTLLALAAIYAVGEIFKYVVSRDFRKSSNITVIQRIVRSAVEFVEQTAWTVDGSKKERAFTWALRELEKAGIKISTETLDMFIEQAVLHMNNEMGQLPKTRSE